MQRVPVSVLEVGSNELSGYEDTVIPAPHDYVRLLTNPKWDGKKWIALAQVNNSLALVEVSLWKRVEGDSNG